MAKEEKDVTLESAESNQPDLKGTFISVSIIGIVIIGSWVGVWALYLSR